FLDVGGHRRGPDLQLLLHHQGLRGTAVGLGVCHVHRLRGGGHRNHRFHSAGRTVHAGQWPVSGADHRRRGRCSAHHAGRVGRRRRGHALMAWLYLLIASFGEIFGVAAINMYLQKKSWQWLLAVVVIFSFGFWLLALAMRDIPLATAYAIWTGLGATGAVLMGVTFFKESMTWLRLLFLACIISGAVGLKLIS